jgi:hypothetical protein
MTNATLPQELNNIISSEKKDFSLKSGRAQPLKKTFSIISVGTILLIIVSVSIKSFLYPIFQGGESHFKINGIETTASFDNLGPAIFPGIIIGIFLIISIVTIIQGIYSIFKKGGYFVGTPTRLIHYQKGKIKSIDWEQFTGNIEINNNALSLEMRTGKFINKKRGADKYIPDIIYISEITNIFEIEKLCRKRIKENDPNPSQKI